MPDQADSSEKPAGDFYKAAEPLDRLTPPRAPEGPGALERLGAAPFAKGKFPFLGFLATLYDHVADRAAAVIRRP